MELRRPLVSNDGIMEEANLPKGEYDLFFRIYDALVSCDLYNRIVWGNKKQNYIDFARGALESEKDGYLLDVPCGPATFTYRLYAENTSRLVIASDLSLKILRYVRKRICKINPQPKVHFIRADALNLPLADQSVQTVLSQGFLHILEDPRPFLLEINRVLKPSGMAFFSSLVNDRHISKLALNFLHLIGYVAPPRNAQQTLDLFKDTGLKIISWERIGGMLYIITRKSNH
jgi:ubiquinone/menaquinone biosynthesis C-methylase UbiE